MTLNIRRKIQLSWATQSYKILLTEYKVSYVITGGKFFLNFWKQLFWNKSGEIYIIFRETFHICWYNSKATSSKMNSIILLQYKNKSVTWSIYKSHRIFNHNYQKVRCILIYNSFRSWKCKWNNVLTDIKTCSLNDK